MSEGKVSPLEGNRKPATGAKRIRRRLAYLLYLAVLFLVPLYFFFYRPFVNGLRDLHSPPAHAFESLGPVPADVLRQVGSLVVDRASSFVNHPVAKPVGETRICAFGDSFTYGDEVGWDQDYPSQLERMLHNRGRDSVRVLNFGSSWHGFHQSYILWERLGRDYGCDTVVFGPRGFWSKRETEFNHTNLGFPYYLHSRYVLEGDGVERVDVLGETHEERFDGYFGFVPKWRYLRYDRNPPAVLRSLVGKNKTLENPFYYFDGSAHDEALEIYRVLLTRVAAETDRVLLMHTREDLLQMARDLELSNLTTFEAFDEPRFPYRAPKGHHSAWGNHAVAARVLQHWAPELGVQESLLVSTDRPASEVASLERRAVSEYRDLAVMLDDHAVGRLVSVSENAFEAGRPAGGWRSTKKSLLVLVGERSNVLDGRWVPLEVELPDGAEVRLRNASGTVDTVLGRVDRIDRNVAIGRLAVPGLRVAAHSDLLWTGDPLDTRDEWEVAIGGEPVLKSWTDGDIVTFWPLDDKSYKLASMQFVDPNDLPDSGTFDLRLVHPTDGEVRIPIADWQRPR